MESQWQPLGLDSRPLECWEQPFLAVSQVTFLPRSPGQGECRHGLWSWPVVPSEHALPTSSPENHPREQLGWVCQPSRLDPAPEFLVTLPPGRTG